jgi:hypothetical protein
MELHDFAGGERSWWAINGILPMIWAEDAYQQWLYGKYSEWSETNGSDDE